VRERAVNLDRGSPAGEHYRMACPGQSRYLHQVAGHRIDLVQISHQGRILLNILGDASHLHRATAATGHLVEADQVGFDRGGAFPDPKLV
jgi:hypothetical protein